METGDPVTSESSTHQGAWAIIDCESTGVDPGSRLIELAAVLIDDDGVVYDHFDKLCNPGFRLPDDIGQLTGICQQDLHGQGTAGEVLRAFFAWLPPDTTLVAHNASFDASLLRYEAELDNITTNHLRICDTIPWARALDMPSLKLQELIHHYQWEQGPAHRALPDAQATVDLWRVVRETLTIEEMLHIAPPEPLPLRWWRATKLPPAMMHIDRLIEIGGKLRFQYTDARGQTSERTIQPWGYAQTKAGLRLHGYCYLRQGRRRFAVERCKFL